MLFLLHLGDLIFNCAAVLMLLQGYSLGSKLPSDGWSIIPLKMSVSSAHALVSW